MIPKPFLIWVICNVAQVSGWRVALLCDSAPEQPDAYESNYYADHKAFESRFGRREYD